MATGTLATRRSSTTEEFPDYCTRLAVLEREAADHLRTAGDAGGGKAPAPPPHPGNLTRS
jgi:hypothetical protein